MTRHDARNPCSLLRSVESALAIATKKQNTARTVAKAIGLEEEERKRRGRGNISVGISSMIWIWIRLKGCS